MADEPLNVPIAVIGMACWYPGARNPRQLWENILARRRQFRRLPDQRLPLDDYYHPDRNEPDKTYGRRAAVIDGFEFDWASRRIPYSTFKTADITHWLALEVAIEAIADAGYTSKNVPGERTAVILGNSLTGEQTRSNTMRLRWPYIQRAFRAAAQSRGISHGQIADIEAAFETYYKSVFPPVNEDSLAGGLSNTIAGRICNFLNLHGGGYTVDGACSSSLLAVATAATGLVNGNLDLALAGGVDISLDPFELVGFAKTAALTMDDMTVYDRRGSGFMPGEGCGFVILKRLDDATRDGDYIYALLHGWGISSDGGGTGLTAPNAKGQARALIRAYDLASYGIQSLHFLEGHGTGTTVGDRAELEAIALAMGNGGTAPEQTERFCGVTSLKSIIGHTKAASGIGGFIKAVMAVNRRILPPTAGCRDPHPVFDSKARFLYPVLQGAVHEPAEILRAGVSAMGFGGINCHVTLESGDAPSRRLEPSMEERSLMVSNQDTEIFVVTADSVTELGGKITDLLEVARDISCAELTGLAAKLGHEVDTKARMRAAVIAGQVDELTERLEQLTTIIKDKSPADGEMFHDPLRTVWLGNRVGRTRVGMLFPGQGSQKLNMARVLVERFPWARETVRQADQWLEEVGAAPISVLIYHPLDRAKNPEETEAWFQALSLTENVQPAICLASYLWVQFLGKLGIKPVAVGGHSLGELTAFHVAGAFDVRDLLCLAAIRGQGMAVSDEQAGIMAGLRCSCQDAEEILKKTTGYVILANINGPRQIVVSGERSGVESAIKIAAEKGIQARQLKVSNAFHSRLASRAAEVLETVEFLPETLTDLHTRLFSSVTGQEVKPGAALRKHFVGQVLAQVDFISMVNSMAEVCDLFLEVGPGRVLSGLANDITGAKGPVCLPVESSAQRDQDMNTALAALFIHGVDIDWASLYEARLVRPFTPPSERLFIDNPCERPFDVSGDLQVSSRTPAPDTLEDLLSDVVKAPRDRLAAYLNKRGSFLADVILADMKHTVPAGIPIEEPEPETLPVEAAQPIMETRAAEVPTPAPEPKADTREDLESMLFSQVERITGFSRDTLSLGMRLLDDLNLDSIKAADLVVQVAKEAGVEGEVESLGLANASLSEITEKLVEHIDKSKASLPGPEKPDALKTVIEQASQITGYPVDTLDADALVEQDLNIGPDMLKDLLQRSGSLLNVETHLDLEPLRQRSLRQIAAILERITVSQPEMQPVAAEAEPEPWVREFAVELVEEPALPLPEWWGKRQEDDWQNINTLILSTPEAVEVAESLRDAMFRHGAQVRNATFREARDQGLAKDAAYSHLFAILPQTPGMYDSHEAHLRCVVEHSASVASPPPASQAPRRRTTVAYIQFGGGYFGTHARFSHINQCCASALAASIHLERTDLRVRVLDFSPALEAKKIAEKTIEEIITPSPFTAVGFDFEMTRRVARPRLMQPASYKAHPVTWSTEDVILVTGGARGITASCAFGLAQATGARMALTGRSAHPDIRPDDPASHEIAETLRKYADKGLVAKYFSCDVCHRESVVSVIGKIREKMGPVTGVVHGAGLNVPRPASQVSIDDALREVSPKILGALNLISAFKDAPPKIIAGLCSIIGITGMPGNAWYGFSNEALDVILRRFEAEHPDTHTLSIAYSIWRDEGMGARMGSVEILKAMGIDAIPSDEGVMRFVRLFVMDPGVHQVIVTSRLGGFDTWSPKALPAPKKTRYLEKLLHATPGVESVFQAHLTLEQDPYLKDHMFHGSYLLPAVFGLEAMAQAVAHVTGETGFGLGRVRIEEIKLKRPITVDPDTGADIVVWAEAQEHEPDSATRVVRTGVSKSNTGVKSDFFSATFVLGLEDKPPRHAIAIPDEPLDIRPRLDLYRENLLFQGPRFQRIDKVWTISAINEKAENAIFSTKIHDLTQVGEEAFPEPLHQAMFLGDPFFRDSLLQSGQLLVPKDTSLPVYIRCLDIYPRAEKEPASILTSVQLNRMEGRETEYTVIAVDGNGLIREKLDGYTARSVTHHDDNPTAADLVLPDKRDSRIVRQALNRLSDSLGLEIPNVFLKYLPGLHDLSREERHKRELPLLHEAILQATEDYPDAPEPCEIRWLDSGKPVVTGPMEDKISISLSHDECLCVCVAGPGPQACNVAPITHCTREQWTGLLGQSRDHLLDALLDDSDTLDRAGTRIWSTMEALHKVTEKNGALLEIINKENDAVLFQGTTNNGPIRILTLSMDLTRGPERIMALVVQEGGRPVAERPQPDYSGYEDLFETHHFEIIDGGPQGQGFFVHRFPVTFRPNAQLSRTVYFSNYFFWLGEVREVGVWPVLRKVGRQFATGKWGVVTNNTRIHILGDATAQDQIEILFWISGPANINSANPIMDLTFDFRKILAGGGYERLAWCEQQVTWVRILEHGIVKPEPYPDYYWEFIKDMLPRNQAPNVPEPLPEPLAHLKRAEGDEEKYRAPSGPIVRPLLHEQTIETSLDNANIVGNIYFANYYAWQGQTRDRYFFNLIPDYYRGTGEKGELLCLECRVDHLREAMPFDRIVVTMALKALKTYSVVLYFEYFRLEPDGTRVKLAFGEHHAVWVVRDSQGRPAPAPFPSKVQEAFRQAIAERK